MKRDVKKGQLDLGSRTVKLTQDESSAEVAENFLEFCQRPIAVSPQPGLNERKAKEKGAIIIGGCALAFNSGWVNAITISHFKGLPTTHVTGHFTMIAIDLMEGRYYMCAHRVLLILCFLFGATMTGMIIPYSSFHLGRHYSRALLLEALFLLLALIIEESSPGNLLFYLGCAISSGIQNAITTRYSGNILRTTHHTGTTTDIGIFIGRMIMGNFQDSWKLYVLIPLPICYMLGGIAGVSEYHRAKHLALLFNILFILFVAASYSVYMYFNIYLTYQNVKKSKKATFDDIKMGNETLNPIAVIAIDSKFKRQQSKTDDNNNGKSPSRAEPLSPANTRENAV